MHLTLEDRHKINFEYAICNSVSKVAQKLKINRKTVQRWIRRYEMSGCVDSMQRSGRKPQVNAEVAKQAMDMLLSGDFNGGKDVAFELHMRGLTKANKPLHRTTIIRHAKAVARAANRPIHAVRTKPMKQLSEENKRKRLNFCKSNQRRNWNFVMFTDRKKFSFVYPGSKVKRVAWVHKGEKRVAMKSSHALCVNMYAGITKFGVTEPHFVAGTSKMQTPFMNNKGKVAKNITSSEYEQVVLKTLLPEGDRLFKTQGIASWVLQQDNDPTHCKAAHKALQAFGKSHIGSSISLLKGWPPNSPDLSPIENVWAYVQAKTEAMGCKTFDDFKHAVVQNFKQVPKSMLNKLFMSMQQRIHQCINKMGDKTKY
jgi:hypothetical protein